MIKTPLDQIIAFLSWFNSKCIDNFDIHVRKPSCPNQDYKTGNWIWITDHENIDRSYIQNKLLNWLRRENSNGSDIFFRPTRFTDHCAIFLDDVPTEKAKRIMQKYSACVIETHKGNTQIWLAVDRKLNQEQRKQAQQILCGIGYTDVGSVSGAHLGRLPGVRSQKRKTWVNLIDTSDKGPWSPDLNQNSEPLSSRKASESMVNNNGRDISQSGKEFGWVMGMLRAGINQKVVHEKLLSAVIQRGKPNPERYTNYTIKKAFQALR